MPNPDFVLIYNPTLGNKRALVSFDSVDDHAKKGWLLVNGSTPAPSSPFLTPAVADARYLRTDDVDDPATPGGAALRAASVAAVKAAAEAGEIELGGEVPADSVALEQLTVAARAAIAAKYVRPASGIPETDLATAVRAKLGGAGARVGSAMRGTDDRTEYAPRLQMVSTQPVVEVGVNLTSASSMYWPSTMRVAGVVSNPRNTWYKVLSTDHDTGAGGIYLMSAPAPEGPWTDHGLVYVDTTAGAQTETPHVVYNPDDPDGKVYYVYYSQGGVGNGQQSTLLAKTATFEAGSWTRIGVVLNARPAADRIGDGHTGYAAVWRVGRTWHARSLQGGSSYSQQALWTSNDGITWAMDPRPLAGNVDSVPEPDLGKVSLWKPFFYRGRPWALAAISSNGASGGGTHSGSLAVFPVTADFRSAIGPVYTFAPVLPWQTTNVKSQSVFTAPDGTVYVEWQTDNKLALAILGETGTAPVTITNPRALPRDSAGRPARLGMVRVEKAFDFIDQVMPTGLQSFAAAGTGAVTFSSSPYPRAQLVTGTASGNDCRLQLPYDIDVTDMSSIWLTAEGVTLSSDDWATTMLMLSGTNTGIRLAHRNDTDLASVNQQTATPITTSVYYKLRGANGGNGFVNTISARRKSTTLLWHIKRQMAYVMEDDQVYAAVPVTSAPLGLIRPALYVGNGTAGGAAGTARTLACEVLKVGWER